MKPVVASSAARFMDLSKIYGILDTEIWICKNMPIYFCDHTSLHYHIHIVVTHFLLKKNSKALRLTAILQNICVHMRHLFSRVQASCIT